MAHEYLLKEYDLCFEQLRFYDERHESLLKYMLSLASAAATAQFGIYKLFQSTTVAFFWCLVLLSGLVFVSTLLLGMAMLQNRLYFVFVARQINAIRGYLMRVAAGGFRNNQMYTSTDFPALKPFSVHTFQLLGAAVISSLFAAITTYALPAALGRKPCIATGVVIGLLILVAEVASGMGYLAVHGRKTADEAVHRKKKVV